MAKIFCIVDGHTGLLNVSLELSRRLRDAGHEISLGALTESRNKVESADFSWLELQPRYLSPGVAKGFGGAPLNKLAAAVRNRVGYKRKRERALAELALPAFTYLLQTDRPDLVIIGMECREYIIATYGEGVPILLLSPWFNGAYLPDLPPLNTLLAPNGSTGYQDAINLAWNQRLAKLSQQRQRRFRWSAGLDRESLLLELANRRGIPASAIDRLGWPAPFTIKGLPVAHTTLDALELPHEQPEFHHYLGPMVPSSPPPNEKGSEVDERLEEMLKRRAQQQRKLIYCSVSTMAEGIDDFLERVVQACAGRKDWLLIVALGGNGGRLDHIELPDNAYVFEWVPQLKVLAEADCSINHAGINTINECIVNEVPMVIYSGGRFDQDGCAARIAYHQLGVVGDRAEDDSVAIRSNIERVLTEPVFRAKISEVNRYAQSEEVRGRLLALVERVMAEGNPVL
ncbi:nucleotide disphospho-sugar-binding domain-containing protein [Lewinella sp. 4G2]|uniref:glycosyltransferase n=1 Tax=Lewinella sp. 4G2 TaxID=1803372 RepID=UPI0007B4EFFD|nr:nucleotide disphospho-sugar-binding domain-containing protein [Lewinella sp. 4G2]OAV43681.1 hypothetical protein A3850_003840 [Lewinella sp. 4G2]